MLALVAITAGVGWATTQIGYMDTEIYFPLVDVNIDLHWLYFPFLFLVIAGTSNGVNLTDGLDGLAAGTCAISLITLLAIASIDWIRSADTVANRSDEYLDIAIVSAALIGGVIGFLWFNAFPAEVFMGDTGSMALGGAIATLAILTETEVLLLFIGGIYLVEALSVMIQVASFKRTGKRVFLMTPIHHHFEMKAWSETKIMVRFWIVGAILCAIGFVLYYRYYLRFQPDARGRPHGHLPLGRGRPSLPRPRPGSRALGARGRRRPARSRGWRWSSTTRAPSSTHRTSTPACTSASGASASSTASGSS